MTHPRGIRAYWTTMAYRIGERLRAGESTFDGTDFRGSRSSSRIPLTFGLVPMRYGGWTTGPSTYAAIERHIERHIERKQRAERQLRAREFPHGFLTVATMKRERGVA